MDRDMLERHLAQAKRHVAQGKAHIEKQHRIIADLERNRHDTADAKDLLSTLLQTQESHERDLQRILEELPK